MHQGPGRRNTFLRRALFVLLLLPCVEAAGEVHAEQQLALLRQAGSLLDSFQAPAMETYQLPLVGRLTSTFGWRNVSVGGNRNHGGIDLAAATGTPVRASLSGTVSFSGWSGAYGYVIYLDHDQDTQTRYAHLSAFAVESGDTVRQGDVIGYVGTTGASTGPHLHFEIRLGGIAVDPLPRLPDGQDSQTGATGGS